MNQNSVNNKKLAAPEWATCREKHEVLFFSFFNIRAKLFLEKYVFLQSVPIKKQMEREMVEGTIES